MTDTYALTSSRTAETSGEAGTQSQRVPQSATLASPISTIILTHNEEANIARCLKALAWCDDVVIVDSGSTDRTLAEAREVRPNVRIFEHPFVDFGQQRNWALDECDLPHDWVLFLDADEVCPPKLAREIDHLVSMADRRKDRDEQPVGYYLTCKNIFLGRWLKRCTLFPTWQLRLLRRGEVRYRREGHGQREVTDGPLGYLETPYDHYGFSQGVFHWIARHNHYSSAEVELVHRLRSEPLALKDLLSRDPVVRRRCLKRMSSHVGCRPFFRFIYLYFIRRGFLDGYAGWVFCQLRVAHEIHITAKLAEEDAAKGRR